MSTSPPGGCSVGWDRGFGSEHGLLTGTGADSAALLPELVCPACRRLVERGPGAFRCRGCDRSFPIVAGIPDLRLAGDRYLSLEEDRAKAEALARVEGGVGDVVRAYWRSTPGVPAHLAGRYSERTSEAVPRAEAHLDRLGWTGSAGVPRLLDVGCGTGGLLVAAARRGLAPAGVDIALRWLVVARRCLDEHGVAASLVAADGALLPFRTHSFDRVTCVETLEHAHDQAGLLHSCLRAASHASYLVTANRFSLAAEPTVGLWGVGFLPRRTAPAYVRWRRGTEYRYFRALSPSRLRALVGPGSAANVGPGILPPAPEDSTATRRAAQRGYEVLRGRAGPLLEKFAPYLEVVSPASPS